MSTVFGKIHYKMTIKGDKSTYYYKFVPRLSTSKITGYDFSYGPLKDVLFAQWIAKTKKVKYDYFPGISPVICGQVLPSIR
ncbi:hypothetical protein ACNFJN_17010 [Xenorhabdus budapestensis]|uniref:hypothetical protein n=1 Tax=Xenorhabdus budapestensis TaxID=290110 RepID=UPI001FD2E1EE|nr:hypothetical protein [Xenorhabdus budapestensis]